MLKIKPEKMVEVLEEASALLYPGDHSLIDEACLGLISAVRLGARHLGVAAHVADTQILADFQEAGYKYPSDAWKDIERVGTDAVIQTRRFDILQSLIGYYNSL